VEPVSNDACSLNPAASLGLQWAPMGTQAWPGWTVAVRKKDSQCCRLLRSVAMVLLSPYTTRNQPPLPPGPPAGSQFLAPVVLPLPLRVAGVTHHRRVGLTVGSL